MIRYNEITNIHAELTTLCNARCPMCVRNAYGYPHNFGYPETSLTLSDIKTILPPDFIQQLTDFNVCGNFGDFVANNESAEILEYIKQVNPEIRIVISTNGGARDTDFWQRLAAIESEIHFCIDGLEDTHSVYRVDTKYNTVIKNAKAFIGAGGTAYWKMIEFDHNNHQIDQARQTAKELEFMSFEVANHGRISGSHFDRRGNLVNTIGPGPHHSNIDNIIAWESKDPAEDYLLQQPEKSCVSCYTQNEKSIYLAANGEIYPCCFLGFYPKTFANGPWYNVANQQIAQLMGDSNNNAIEVGVEQAIEWFTRVEESWQVEKYSNGRTRMCDHHCGKTNYVQTPEQL